jgi:hypothetical protein
MRVKAGDPVNVGTKLDERLELHHPSRREIGGSSRHDTQQSTVCMCKVRHRASLPYGHWKPQPLCLDLCQMVQVVVVGLIFGRLLQFTWQTWLATPPKMVML